PSPCSRPPSATSSVSPLSLHDALPIFLGPLAQQSLSGGAGGMRHVLDHLGPPQEVWMHDLKQVHLDEVLKEKLIAGVDDELAGRDSTAIARQRDEMLISLLELKSRYEELP